MSNPMFQNEVVGEGKHSSTRGQDGGDGLGDHIKISEAH